MSDVILRPATAADLDSLAAIYVDAVQTLGPQAYTAEAVAAWQRWPQDDPAEFRQRVFAGHTWLAEVEGEVAAYAEFVPPDHLDFLYTRGRFARRGLATRLHERLEALARETGATLLRTEASLISRFAFAKFGYEVVEIETVERYGQLFRRYVMRKLLGLGPPATSPVIALREGYTAAFAQAPRVQAEETVHYQGPDLKNPGWFKGRDTHGIEGYFPTAWFDIDASNGQATAQRDYDASELTVTTGDPVGVIEIESGWARVMSADGEVGWVPEDCMGSQ